MFTFLLTLCMSWASDFLPFLLFSDSVRMKISASCISRVKLDFLELVNVCVVWKVGVSMEVGRRETCEYPECAAPVKAHTFLRHG